MCCLLVPGMLLLQRLGTGLDGPLRWPRRPLGPDGRGFSQSFFSGVTSSLLPSVSGDSMCSANGKETSVKLPQPCDSATEPLANLVEAFLALSETLVGGLAETNSYTEACRAPSSFIT
ncbi:unnamed protein product [Gulo gulo]|uniref:Uncharacterized protein n=1 Tax=Gulo gulo TaxID=48420 RepID=A0A9X9LXA1_GULGU|nr:unnamed protein product [Gulo gulo]